MPQITLSKAEVKRLIKFCDDKAITHYFIAKDQGAYLGASKGAEPGDSCIFYFAGCNPEKDADWWENSSYKFGGDDFGEHLDLDWLKKAIERAEAWEADMQRQGKKFKPVKGIQWNVTKTKISTKIV